jgi:hypothetical protein
MMILSAMQCALCNQFQGRWPIDNRVDSHKHRGQGVRSLMIPKVPWEDLLGSASNCYGCDIILVGCRGVFNQHDIKESDIVHGSIRFLYPSHIEDVEEADCDKHLILQLATGRRFEVELFATEEAD